MLVDGKKVPNKMSCSPQDSYVLIYKVRISYIITFTSSFLYRDDTLKLFHLPLHFFNPSS